MLMVGEGGDPGGDMVDMGTVRVDVGEVGRGVGDMLETQVE